MSEMKILLIEENSLILWSIIILAVGIMIGCIRKKIKSLYQDTNVDNHIKYLDEISLILMEKNKTDSLMNSEIEKVIKKYLKECIGDVEE